MVVFSFCSFVFWFCFWFLFACSSGKPVPPKRPQTMENKILFFVVFPLSVLAGVVVLAQKQTKPQPFVIVCTKLQAQGWMTWLERSAQLFWWPSWPVGPLARWPGGPAGPFGGLVGPLGPLARWPGGPAGPAGPVRRFAWLDFLREMAKVDMP